MPFHSENLVESDGPIDFGKIYSERYALFEISRAQITAPTMIFSHRVSEMFQWCLDHISNFEVFRTKYGRHSNLDSSLVLWLFYIPDTMEAMVFKLRWKSE
jgi:hypothetical protein